MCSGVHLDSRRPAISILLEVKQGMQEADGGAGLEKGGDEGGREWVKAMEKGWDGEAKLGKTRKKRKRVLCSKALYSESGRDRIPPRDRNESAMVKGLRSRTSQLCLGLLQLELGRKVHALYSMYSMAAASGRVTTLLLRISASWE